MRFTAKRLIGAGVIGIAAIVTPISLSVALPAVSNVTSSVAGAQGPFDELTYNQYTTGSPLNTDQYVPAVTPVGGPPGPQGLNVSGNCATPTTAGQAAVLAMCGALWPLDFSGTAKSATLGTNTSQGPATGVGAITPAWTIDTKSNKGSEALDFSPGDPGVIGPNRFFTDAQIPVARKDTGNTGIGMVTVQLAEFSTSLPTPPSAANLVGTQNCTINGPTGTGITVDPDTCTVVTPAPAGLDNGNHVPLSFGTIEVRDATEGSTAIAVVGQTATFELINSACPGNPVQATDPNNTGVSATLTLTGASGPGCKPYTSFIATPGQNGPTLAFNGFSSQAVTLTVNIKWPAVPLCSPYADVPSNSGGVFPGGSTPIPGSTTGIADVPASPPYAGVVGGAAADMCPIHLFQFNGIQFTDQAYCQTATTGTPQQELCTVTKNYNNDILKADGTVATNGDGTVQTVTTSTGAPGTQITENWVGVVDMGWK
jgi:hypothetical protein